MYIFFHKKKCVCSNNNNDFFFLIYIYKYILPLPETRKKKLVTNMKY